MSRICLASAHHSHHAASVYTGLLGNAVGDDEHVFVIVHGDNEFIGGLEGIIDELSVLVEQDARALWDIGTDRQAQFIRGIEREDIICDLPGNARLRERQLSVDGPGFVPDRDRTGIVGGIRADGVDTVGLRGIDDQIHVRNAQTRHVAEHRPVVRTAAREVHGDGCFADFDAGSQVQVRCIPDRAAEDRTVAEIDHIALLQVRVFQCAAGRDEQAGNKTRALFHAGTAAGKDGHAADRTAFGDSCITAGFNDRVNRFAAPAYDVLAEHGRITGNGTITHIKARLGIDERVDGRLPGIQGCIRPPPVVGIPDDLAAGDHGVVECCKAGIRVQRDIVQLRAGGEPDISRVGIVVEPEVGPGGDDHVFRPGAIVDRQCRTCVHCNIQSRLAPVKVGICAIRRSKRGEDKVLFDYVVRPQLEIVHISALRQRGVLQNGTVVQIQSAPGCHIQVCSKGIVANRDLAICGNGGMVDLRVVTCIKTAAIDDRLINKTGVVRNQIAAVLHGHIVRISAIAKMHAARTQNDVLSRSGHVQFDVIDDLGGRDDAAVFNRNTSIPNITGQICAFDPAAARNPDIPVGFRPQVGNLSAAVHDRAVAACHGQIVHFIAAADQTGLISAVIHVVCTGKIRIRSALGNGHFTAPRVERHFRRAAAQNFKHGSTVYDRIFHHAAFVHDRTVS